MAAIWLAAYRDGSARARFESPSLRSRIVLPPAQCLRRLLVDVGGPGFDSRVLLSLSEPGEVPLDACGVMGEAGHCRAPIMALVLLKCDGCCWHGGHGPAWSEQTALQLDAYHRHVDATRQTKQIVIIQNNNKTNSDN